MLILTTNASSGARWLKHCFLSPPYHTRDLGQLRMRKLPEIVDRTGVTSISGSCWNHEIVSTLQGIECHLRLQWMRTYRGVSCKISWG
ncbi:hypothetical protein M513_11477 [Trichuris suis]|uniref:Uncharacterized protein n=1 Tax=Trichuris suis TaxID=68888 RepID=A0A085LRU0_9BILA|nr:hypothetical protein M513_11477 [Trichuris suis]